MVVYTLVQCWELGMRSTYRRCRFLQKKIYFSGEAHFDFGGYVNNQNYRTWGTKNPDTHSKVDAPKTSHCLVRILIKRYNWTIFFANEQGETITVNGDSYQAMLK